MWTFLVPSLYLQSIENFQKQNLVNFYVLCPTSKDMWRVINIPKDSPSLFFLWILLFIFMMTKIIKIKVSSSSFAFLKTFAVHFYDDNDPSHLHSENAFLMLYWIQLQTNQISQAKVSWLSKVIYSKYYKHLALLGLGLIKINNVSANFNNPRP